MPSVTKRYCSADVWHQNSFRPAGCSKAGVIESGGKLYCRIHDPVAVKARRDAREKRWEEKSLERTRRWAKEDLIQKMEAEAIDLLRSISAGHNDPRSIATDFVKRWDAVPKDDD